jgi:hypothetical protein
MAALGVRFLLTDVEQTDPALTLRASERNPDDVPLLIYELPDPNLGNYSPTEPIAVGDAAAAVALMKDPAFEFDKKFILIDKYDIPRLAPARLGKMSFERGGVRVRARSDAPSLLVLPIQFSNALRIVESRDAGTSLKPALIRVNLLQVGVLFSGDLDIKVAHIFGLFRSLSGRGRDIEDSRRLGIVETGEVPYPPDFQPLALRRVVIPGQPAPRTSGKKR